MWQRTSKNPGEGEHGKKITEGREDKANGEARKTKEAKGKTSAAGKVIGQVKGKGKNAPRKRKKGTKAKAMPKTKKKPAKKQNALHKELIKTLELWDVQSKSRTCRRSSYEEAEIMSGKKR